MDSKKIMSMFADTAYVRMGGTDAELQAAEYIRSCCAELGFSAEIEEFDVPMATLKSFSLHVDGKEIPCKGYFNAGCAEVEAPFYYLRNLKDKHFISEVKGKIVMIDGYLGYWVYQDLVDNGAVGFITYDGNANYADRDIDQRELRSYVSQGRILPGVNINAKDAIVLIRDGAKTAKITLCQDEYTGKSRNVVLNVPGEREEYITLTAHYDSTSLSQGAYDNMSGSIGLLGILEHFASHPHSYGMRFIWCGSEERGLLGSKAYCIAHESELDKCVLNINLDMIGCIMGKFISCATAEDKLVHYINYFSMEQGFGVDAYQDVYSSDSTPFADRGVPAVSFCRAAPGNTATIHNSYDTMALMSGEQMVKDIAFLVAFTDRMVNAVRCPVAREIPENIKEKLDTYLARKRPK